MTYTYSVRVDSRSAPAIQLPNITRSAVALTIREIGEKKTNQCVMCELYPATAYAYAHHLGHCHKSTLKANGVYLLCACGIKVVCAAHNPKHSKECDG
ncbi:hypothetical protein PENTCL1PPCAC_13380 [Pristionchus entomophagus]|uniref:C2H2-type domain-containing protein n=1 Tax=Pristionchus entomophagus TaxID=358040 RepID=A0AAV5T6Q2_9BILA|nr:hypothetical protein PENTCL1PPCAC_13380 [Pristionchus entomophagus]